MKNCKIDTRRLGVWLGVLVWVVVVAAAGEGVHVGSPVRGVMAQGAIDALATQAAYESLATVQAIEAARGAAAAQAAAAQAAAAAAQAAYQATQQASVLQSERAALAATSQAAVLQATFAAAATEQAAAGQATAQAVSATFAAAATGQAIEAEATRQSYAANVNATATAYRAVQDVQATHEALAAQATAAAIGAAIQAGQDQARLGQVLLYVAVAIVSAACGWIAFAWARNVAMGFGSLPRSLAYEAGGPLPSSQERRGNDARPYGEKMDGAYEVRGEAASMPGGVVIDVGSVPALPNPAARMKGVYVVDDHDLVDRVRAHVAQYGIGADEDE